MPDRWIRAALAPLVCVILYWPALGAWFQKDDFAWLSLRFETHEHGLAQALFTPMAQGSVRVWSERVYFLVFSSVFGLDALPYHLLTMAVQAANAVLLRSIVVRLTGSEAAGLWAPLLWIANNCVAPAMTWASGFNQVACAFVLLLAFRLFLARRTAIQTAVLAMGFGVLETVVVYPALAALYARISGRCLRAIAPLAALSVAFVAWHFHVAPLPDSGPYQPHWADAPRVLWTYWKMALGPSRLGLLGIPASLGRSALTAAMTAALVIFVVREVRRGQWTAAWFAAWFLLTLAPVLPLRDHVIDAYLTVPLAGLASVAAMAAVQAWRSGGLPRAAACLLVVAYLAVSVPLGRVLVNDIGDRSLRLRAALETIARETRGRPVDALFVRGASPSSSTRRSCTVPCGCTDYPSPCCSRRTRRTRPKAAEWSWWICPDRRFADAISPWLLPRTSALGSAYPACRTETPDPP